MFLLAAAAIAQDLPAAERLADDELGVEEGDEAVRYELGEEAARVAGGRVTSPGSWPDAVGVAFGNQVGCTGTLIAPDVVLTAGHCVGNITDIVVGDDWTRASQVVGVRRTIEYPRSQATYDVALLLLDRDVQGVTPRPIAVDCIAEDLLRDGAEVAVVGFGATDYAGNRNTTRKHEGFTEVADADCSQGNIDGFSSGCRGAARPAGEVAAGGNGVDSCFGDSGGPLYLLGEDGQSWLAGVTSRGYAGVPYDTPCRYGGIYTRPDAVLSWIEDNAGPVALPTCNHKPEVLEDRIVAEGPTAVHLAFDDEDPAPRASWRVVRAPRHGKATLANGTLRYEPDAGYSGDDDVVVEVDDGGNPDWPRTGGPLVDQGTIRFDVRSEGGKGAPQSPADTDSDEVGSAPGAVDSTYHSMGCATVPSSTGAGVLALLALAVRRRR